MSTQDLPTILRQLHHNISQNNHQNSTALLTRAKVALLHQNALIPTARTPPAHLQTAQQVLETGALISIRLQDPAAFTRYFQQLQPFYTLSSSSGKHSQRSKVTGLYLLLLLSQGDYAGFHTLLEGLDVAANQAHEQGTGKGLEEDEFVQYPIRLEQWLMEGSYDRVWDETKSERVPSEEFAIFSDVSLGLLLICYATPGCANLLLLDPPRDHPLRSRVVLGEGIPVYPRRKREEPALPRQRRQRRWVLRGARLEREGRQNTLPDGGRGAGREERVGGEEGDYHEHAGLR